MRDRKRKFTLVELMLVVFVISVLAALAIPNFVRSRTVSRQGACINNLRIIDNGKEQAAMATNLNYGDDLSQADVNSYIRGGQPRCPAHGSYTYGPVGVPPTCDVSGHSL